eukprot:1142854-Pelagomonas_calceolata.AAC.7
MEGCTPLRATATSGENSVQWAWLECHFDQKARAVKVLGMNNDKYLFAQRSAAEVCMQKHVFKRKANPARVAIANLPVGKGSENGLGNWPPSHLNHFPISLQAQWRRLCLGGDTGGVRGGVMGFRMRVC